MRWKMPSCPPRPPKLGSEIYTLNCDGVKRKIKWKRVMKFD